MKSAQRPTLRPSEDADTAKPSAAGGLRLGPLESFVGFHLRLAQNASFHAFARRVGVNDLKPGRFAIMALIGQNPGLTPTALSAASGRDKSTITPALRDLETRGFVRRARDPSDGRSCTLTLTPAGEVMLERMTAHAAEHDRELDAIVGEENKAEFLRILKRITETLA